MIKKLTLILLLFLMWTCSRDEHSIPSQVSYNAHIRPILSDKCFKCHGPDEKKRLSGYRLDTPDGAYAALKDKPNAYGIVKGNADLSEVYRRITSQDPHYKMPTPESNLTLTPYEIALVKKWIDQGAVYEAHWAFMPVKNINIPDVKSDWVTSPIDRFVFEKMRAHGLQPSPIENDDRLLKRLYHDIIGLPPTIAQQEAYQINKSKQKYEQTVDALLANPHFGEKMAVLWMDIARYADSHGYQDDGLRTMWPWRDWVIHAFNQNYSYKKFITYQLAGDLLPEANKETILATGFNRNHKITQEGGVVDEEYRIEYVSDRTNTFSKGILALTLECAKCHDHKYDPISQKDYYSTFAFFDQVPEKGYAGDIFMASLADPPILAITEQDRRGLLNFIHELGTDTIHTMVMQDSSGMRQTHILNRGVYDQKGTVVKMNTPKAILEFDTLKYPKNRLGLSQWLFDVKNPLTARVFVNLMWQEFFGRGIVRTSGDFGLQGELPSHPELLDWLAYDFISHEWDIKRLIKLMVMSSSYRQSSSRTDNQLAIDPENIYLSCGPRIKLSAELIKDHVLASSGLLNAKIGGPSIKSYQPKGLWEVATSGRGQLAAYVQDHGNKIYKRGLYHFIKRTVPPAAMLIFDAPNRDQCEVRRATTSTPTQSLVMMNDIYIAESSRYLAQNLLKNTKIDLATKINTAFRSIVCRQPKKEETSKLQNYHAELLKKLTSQKADQLLKIGECPSEPSLDKVQTAALMQTILLIYNLEETSVR